MQQPSQYSTALVLETNNLRGGEADVAQITLSVARLLSHLQDQSWPLSSLQELVITHDGLPPESQRKLSRAAGVNIRFVEITQDTDYYEAKNKGFDATTADLVAFGDADCWPEEEWLEQLFRPFFQDPSMQVVAGRTTYRKDLLGTAASTIDFMYFKSPLGETCTRNFYANNVAFRRELFGAYRYTPAEGIYRGHCQILGMKLQEAKIPVYFAPKARTIHRFPDSARELLALRLLRGQDTTEITPQLTKTYAPKVNRVVRRLGPVGPLSVLAARFAFSVRAVNHQEMPKVSGLRYLACLGYIAGFSMVDAVGAFWRAARLPALVAPKERSTLVSLSYHKDKDKLAA